MKDIDGPPFTITEDEPTPIVRDFDTFLDAVEAPSVYLTGSRLVLDRATLHALDGIMRTHRTDTHPRTDLYGPAVELVAKTGSGLAAWLLGELGRFPATGALGEKARSLADGLARTGVVPRAPSACDFSHGMVFTTDGSGSRSFTLFNRTGEGGLDALAVLVNDRAGMKDVWCVFGGGEDVDERTREESAGASRWAPCSVEFARELVADAMATHEEIGRPFPGRFLLYRHFLGTEPIASARRTPDLGAYEFETVVGGPGLVKGSKALMDCPIYCLWYASDEAYEFLAKLQPKQPSSPRRGGKSFSLPRGAFDEFVARIASKERETLARRMAVNLEVEALAGRATKRVNRLAARTWLALVEGVVPFEKIPYIRALCRRSVEAIGKNLQMGFKSQEEANNAGLVLEEEAAQVVSSPLAEEW